MGCSCSNQRGYFGEENTMIPCNAYKELDEYIGSGIKKTHAWTGTITQSQLKVKRDKFWASISTGHMFIWLQIKQAVEADAENAEAILQYGGVRMIYDSIQVCKDFEGNRYFIPAFVINDPVELTESDIEDIDDSEILEIVIRKSKEPDISVCVPLGAKVRQLKSEIGVPDCRLFFGGKELQDYKKLYDYQLEDGMVVQIFCGSKDNKV